MGKDALKIDHQMRHFWFSGLIGLALMLACVRTCSAEAGELPEAPQPQPATAKLATAPALRPFWDKQQTVAQIANLGIRLTDAIRSCQLPGREASLPTQSCAGTTAWILGVGVGGEYVLARALHHYHHDRLAHAVPWVFFVVDSYAVGYTFTKEWPNRSTYWQRKN